MIGLALIVLIAIIGGTAYLATRTTRHSPPKQDGSTDRLAEWVRAGLITDEQSRNIVAFEQRAELTPGPTPGPTRGPTPGPPPGPRAPIRRSSAVAEALGYLGGMLVLGAAIALAAPRTAS